jgi:hypothetical protein
MTAAAAFSGSGAALTRPVAGRLALTTTPSPSETITDGMVIVGSVPPIVVGGPGTLLTTIVRGQHAVRLVAIARLAPRRSSERSPWFICFRP